MSLSKKVKPPYIAALTLKFRNATYVKTQYFGNSISHKYKEEFDTKSKYSAFLKKWLNIQQQIHKLFNDNEKK